MVEKGTPGFTFGKKEDKLGIRASATRELIFQDCRVPVANCLGREGTGFITAMKTFDVSRPGVGAQAVGIAQERSTWRSSTPARAASSVPRSARSRDCALCSPTWPPRSKPRALWFMPQRAYIDTKPKERPTLYAAMSKCFASDVAMEVTTDAVQIFGGYGYMHDYPIEKYMRDAKITQIYEGTNQIQREEMSKTLISNFHSHRPPAARAA